MLKIFKKTYTLPFKYDIPNCTQKYLDTTSFLKRFAPFFRRYLYIALNSHLSLEQNKIKKEQKNILWINLSAPSLGDSLMDLSSRILLEDKNIDLVIIDSYSTKSLRTKFTYLETLPYVGIYGYYNGPEVNRVLYSFHRMNQLLGYIKTEDTINKTAKSIMYILHKEERIIDNIDLPNSFITIAIGGEWDYRTYNNWDKVISSILDITPEQNIILIGSHNAENEEEKLLKKFGNFNITSVVAKYSFEQTAQIIKKSDVLLCCDGGLMHAANGVDTTIIPLFAHLTPKMQLTNAIKAYPMYDKINVNNIKVDEVITNYKKYLEEK